MIIVWFMWDKSVMFQNVRPPFSITVSKMMSVLDLFRIIGRLFHGLLYYEFECLENYGVPITFLLVIFWGIWVMLNFCGGHDAYKQLR